MVKRGFNKNDERDFGTFKDVVELFITANKNKKDALSRYQVIERSNFLQNLPYFDIYLDPNYFNMTMFLHESVEELIRLLDKQDRDVYNDSYIIALLGTFLNNTNIKIRLTCIPDITKPFENTFYFNIIKLIVMLCSISMIKFDEMKKIKERYENREKEMDEFVESLRSINSTGKTPEEEAQRGKELDDIYDKIETDENVLKKDAFLQCLGVMEEDKKTQLFNKISQSDCAQVNKKNPYLVRFQTSGSEITNEEILEIYTRFLAKYKEMLTNKKIGNNNTIKPLLAVFQFICITKCGLQMPSDEDKFKFEERPKITTRISRAVKSFFTRVPAPTPAPATAPAPTPAPAPVNGGSIRKTKKQKTKKNHSKSKKSRKNKTRR